MTCTSLRFFLGGMHSGRLEANAITSRLRKLPKVIIIGLFVIILMDVRRGVGCFGGDKKLLMCDRGDAPYSVHSTVS
jgi:hypothetical protein